ncbi:hypothetical protein ACVNF4_03940 [Streptomyces sp. S6]
MSGSEVAWRELLFGWAGCVTALRAGELVSRMAHFAAKRRIARGSWLK